MKKKSKAEEVYELIKADLLANNPARNVLLTEQNLANLYNTSRTPVHEALARLCLEGYVTKYPKKGYIITSTDLDKKRYTKAEFRCIVETGVLWQVVNNASDKDIAAVLKPIPEDKLDRNAIIAENKNFHLSLAELSRNNEVVTLLEGLLDDTAWNIVFMGPIVADYEEMMKVHQEIVDALLKRDFVAAAKWIYEDIMPTVSD